MEIKLKNMDRRTIVYLGIGLGSIIFIILLLIILKLAVGSKITTTRYEERLKNSAISYYKDHAKKLPVKDGTSSKISIEALEKKGYIKKQKGLIKKGVTCEGFVKVDKNNGLYLYQPNIKCSDGYETKLLYKQVLKNNPVSTKGEGLYQINDSYVFRGENLNNYVTFANLKWRIVRINKDNTIKLIILNSPITSVWDDRYNSVEKDNVGKNNFSVSRIKEELTTTFNDEDYFSKNSKAYIVPSNFCSASRNNIGAIDGSIECVTTTEKMPLGLLAAYEFALASIDSGCNAIGKEECTNYNYLSRLTNYWTITPYSGSTYQAYTLRGTVKKTYLSSRLGIVINLSSNTLLSSGTGTKQDPYIIK